MDPTIKVIKRKSNFSNRELGILLELVEDHKHELFGSFSQTITSVSKEKTWKLITAQINAVSDAVREWQEVRKKWQDFSSKAKVRSSAIRRDLATTGGGPRTTSPLTTAEQKALNVIGETAVHGIHGGVDSAAPVAAQTARETPPPSNVAAAVPHSPATAESSPAALFDTENTLEDELGEETVTLTSLAPLSLPTAAVEDKRKEPKQSKKRSAGSSDVTAVPAEGAQLLDIERKRLHIEERRLAIEEEKLQLKKEYLEMKKYKYNYSLQHQQIFYTQQQSSSNDGQEPPYSNVLDSNI